MTDPVLEFLLVVVKCIVIAYDVITLPIYMILQKPWKSWKNEIWSEQMDKSDPYSPYVRTKYFPDYIFGDEVTTAVEAFRKAIREHGDKPCFGVRQILGEVEVKSGGKVLRKLDLGDYKWLTYKEADVQVDEIGRGLLSIGVKSKEPVVIFAETRLEWMLSALAAFRIGAQVVTLYANLGDDGIVHGINETDTTVLITSTDLLPKLQKVIHKLPKLKYVIYMEGLKFPQLMGFPEHLQILPFSQLVNIGSKTSYEAFEFQSPTPDDVAIIMYTSGSTGKPKGVMISHGNFVSMLKMSSTNIDTTTLGDNKRFLAFLPLAHIFEFSFELLILGGGGTVAYSSPNTFTDKSTAIIDGQKGDATLIKPLVIIGVPLLLDRVRKNANDVVESKGPFMKGLFQFAIDHNDFWARVGFDCPLMSRLVFRRIRQLVGGEVQYFITGGAPLSPDTNRFIRTSMGVTLLQGYGMTETTSIGTVTCVGDLSVGRVGPPQKGCYIRLIDWEEGGYRVTDKPHPRGEIIVGGPAVSIGYYKNEALTKETFFTENGIRWCRTGDIGEMFPDGSMKVIDRKKDLVKLQFGEYIALGKVESELKTCELVENVCVYGNSFQTYLIALIVPNAAKLAALAETELGKKCTDLKELCNDPEVIEIARKSLIRHCQKCNLQKFETPSKIKLCHEEWLPENGFVTSSFKIKRAPILSFYRTDIDRLYNVPRTGGSSESRGS